MYDGEWCGKVFWQNILNFLIFRRLERIENPVEASVGKEALSVIYIVLIVLYNVYYKLHCINTRKDKDTRKSTSIQNNSWFIFFDRLLNIYLNFKAFAWIYHLLQVLHFWTSAAAFLAAAPFAQALYTVYRLKCPFTSINQRNKESNKCLTQFQCEKLPQNHNLCTSCIIILFTNNPLNKMLLRFKKLPNFFWQIGIVKSFRYSELTVKCTSAIYEIFFKSVFFILMNIS